jgi:hypothetical protein
MKNLLLAFVLCVISVGAMAQRPTGFKAEATPAQHFAQIRDSAIVYYCLIHCYSALNGDKTLHGFTWDQVSDGYFRCRSRCLSYLHNGSDSSRFMREMVKSLDSCKCK